MSRGGQEARTLLGKVFSGILATDRSCAYTWYPVQWHQFCWAHLLRDGAAIRGRGGISEGRGDALLAQAPQMFPWWHWRRERTLQRSTFRSYLTPRSREVERLLAVGSQCGGTKTAGTYRESAQRRQALGTFLPEAGVDPTAASKATLQDDAAPSLLPASDQPSQCAA